MGTRAKFAKWIKDGRLYRVQHPGWPRQCELSFTDQEAMVEWSKGAKVMLKDGNVRRGNSERYSARNFG